MTHTEVWRCELVNLDNLGESMSAYVIQTLSRIIAKPLYSDHLEDTEE